MFQTINALTQMIKTNISKIIEVNQNLPKIILIDWLNITVDEFLNYEEIENQVVIGNFVFSLIQGRRTPHFNRVYEVHHFGVKVATMTAESNHPLILKDRCQIKFENHVFYDGSLKTIYHNLKNELGLKNISISRIDIAVDGVNFHELVAYHYYYEQQNEIVIPNDRDNITPIGDSRAMRRNCVFDSFRVGNRGKKSKDGEMAVSKSDRLCRYYNKTREILEASHKKYISDFHEKNGLQGEVYRFEVELSAKFLSHRAFDIESIFDTQYLERLFISGVKNFFEFRLNDNKRVARCTSINFFGGIGQASPIERVKKVVQDTLRTIKSGIKSLVKSCTIGSFSADDLKKERDIIIESIFHQIRVFDLAEWFSRVSPTLFEQILFNAKKLDIKPQNTQLKIFA